jgi:hypothetical protein
MRGYYSEDERDYDAIAEAKDAASEAKFEHDRHHGQEVDAEEVEAIDENQASFDFNDHVDAKHRKSISIGDWTFFGHSLHQWLKHWCLEVEYCGSRYAAVNLGGSTQDFRDVTGVNEYDGLSTAEQHQIMQKYVLARADKFVDELGTKLSEVLQ